MNAPRLRRRVLSSLVALSAFVVLPAQTQTFTLRLHQFLPQQTAISAKAIIPWAQKVDDEPGGRIRIELFQAMQMGRFSPQQFDQAKGGVADIPWTVLGYTPVRFNTSEGFERPFICRGGPEGCSRAFHECLEKSAADEFRSEKLLAAHTRGTGLFQTKAPVTGLESLHGMKIRGGSRIINEMLVKPGATPAGMSVSDARALIARNARLTVGSGVSI